MALPKWKLLELGAVFVEADLSRFATDVSVLHDQQLPDRVTGRRRQVDGVVRFTEGGRRYLRTIEVQRRGAKVGTGDLDKFIQKADRLGAQRTTIVAEAGFTGPAVERLPEHAALIDAIHMKTVRRRSLPSYLRDFRSVRMMDDTQQRVIGDAKLDSYAYVSIPSGDIWRYVFLASPNLRGTDAVVALLVEPEPDDDTARFIMRALTKPGGRREISRVGMTFEYKDGTVETLEVRRPPGVQSVVVDE
ncbi:MAG: hypothetical protein V3R95_05775 [Dehalococcoidia bacterium]